MIDSHWLTSDVASAMGWALVHSVWQGVVAAVVLAGVMWMMRRSSAGARYLVACASLAGVVVALGLTFWIKLPAERIAMPPFEVRPPVELAEAPVVTEPLEVPAIESLPWTLDRAMPWVVAAWLIGVVVLSLWQFGGWMLLGRYRRLAIPADEAWMSRLGGLISRIRVRPVSMRITQHLHIPVVIGTLRPCILMPAAVLANLSIPQIEAILAHELAHVRRYDYLVNLIQSAIETLLFYHPAVWWISKQIRREREFCCDEIAANVCGDRTTYARALAALEQSRGIRLAPAAGGGGRGELLERVKRLLNPPPTVQRRAGQSRSWVMAAGVLMACVAVGVWSRRLVAQAVPGTHPSEPSSGPAPTTAPSVLPEDLVAGPDFGVYQIGPSDLLQISITNLSGPELDHVKAWRVGDTGEITLPFIGKLVASGLTINELEERISRAYRDRNLLRDVPVTVTVLEGRGRMYSIVGDIEAAGEYVLVNSSTRLFDALLAGWYVDGPRWNIRIQRKSSDPAKPRVIEIPSERFAARDPKINIVIRPRDVILVTAPPGPTTTPTASRGSTATADSGTYVIGGRIHRSGVYALSQRGTTLRAAMIGAGGPEVDAQFVSVFRSYSRFDKRPIVANESLPDILSGRAPDMLLQADDEIMLSAEPKVVKSAGPNEGEYYLGGKVVRGGVYALNPRGVTVRAAVIAAGGPDVGGNFVTVIRRTNGNQQFVLRDEPLNELMDGRKADVALQVDDQIMITEKADPTRPTTLPAIRGAGAWTSAPRSPELQKALDDAVVAAKQAWTDLDRRFDGGEAYTPAMVMLQFELALRISETRRAAATSTAEEVAAAEEYLNRCEALGKALQARIGQDVTSVQISQANSAIARARVMVLELKSRPQ